MKEITLKFGGTIYMEWYGEQEEEDRIKVFDSDKEYLDYFSVEGLQDTAYQYPGMSIQDILDFMGNKMAEKESIEALLDNLGVNWLAIYPSAAALHKTEGLEVTNEWVNHIGKYYVLVDEY